jgi:hypothetical protein
MYLKQLNRIESAIKSRLGEIPNVHVIFVKGYQTKQQALDEYKDKNHTDPGDIFYEVLIYPDYVRYEHTSFVTQNGKLVSQMMNEGFTLDEILKRYVI